MRYVSDFYGPLFPSSALLMVIQVTPGRCGIKWKSPVTTSCCASTTGLRNQKWDLFFCVFIFLLSITISPGSFLPPTADISLKEVNSFPAKLNKNLGNRVVMNLPMLRQTYLKFAWEKKTDLLLMLIKTGRITLMTED